jgi:hypothetical protein
MGTPPSDETHPLDLKRQRGIKDSQAIETIKRIAHVSACSDFANDDRDERDRVLALLKKEGLSIRQISRLTEINRGIIQRA